MHPAVGVKTMRKKKMTNGVLKPERRQTVPSQLLSACSVWKRCFRDPTAWGELTAWEGSDHMGGGLTAWEGALMAWEGSDCMGRRH